MKARVGRWALASMLWFVSGSAWALPDDFSRVGDESVAFPGEPGSGEGLGDERLRPPRPSRLQAPLPRRPRDEAEAEAIDELERLSQRYRQAHEAASHTTMTMLEIEAALGQRALKRRYDESIALHRKQAQQLRAQVVRRYQDFLHLHPDDATWTPEIMFRLADLHLETARERLARAEELWQDQLDAYQREAQSYPNADPPPAPEPDYNTVVGLYRDIVHRFPRYHRGDAALYMMGALLGDMNEIDQSRQSYLALACGSRFPAPLKDGSNLSRDPFETGDYDECQPWRKDSKYADEAWLRLGEMHYDVDEYDPALAAYGQVVEDPQADLYDEALIRMAWTLYLMRRFPEAAERLDEFVRFADAHRDQKDEGGALGLRPDAIRYLAKTYIEEDWNLDGRRDAVWGMSRLDRDYKDRGDERHVPEIYAALGDLLAEETRYFKAIDIWQMTLDRWPLAPSAPSIQARIYAAYELLQEPTQSLAARDKLATNYLRGTEWFYANEDDPEAIEEAFKLAEEALVATALEHHANAQQLRAQGDQEGAKAEYTIAARAYEAYLERFPDTPSSYEFRFNFAESLYYSGRYIDSAEQYEAVRDSNIDNRLQEDAASGAVLAYEAHVDSLEQQGALDVPDMPKEGMEGPFDKPLEIPEVMVAMRDAYDRFVAVLPDAEQSGTMKYLAGSISQKYLHFDDAEQRFAEVLASHCEDNVSINAGLAILDGKVVQGDLEGARYWTQKLGESGCGEGEAAEKFAGQLKTLGNAVRFKEATILYDAGKFEAAADRYVALVNESPDDPNADRALNNAAVAYESIGRFGSASQTYKRIYTQYPDSEFADDALLRTGFNHSRFFEFEEAVESYLVLAEDKRYEASEHRENALWNAADLLDNLQEYKRSAAMFQRFAEKSEDREKAGEAAFRAAEVLGKTSDHRATIKAYQAFLAEFDQEPSQAENVVGAHLEIGKAYARLGNRREAEQSYQTTVSVFEAKGLKPASEAADYPSEAQFLLAEYSLQDVLETKVTSMGKRMEQEVKQLTDRLLAAANGYDQVFPYRRIDWVLAAMYRRGYAFETWAINIRGAPVPRKLKEYSEAWFAYKDAVDQFATTAETKAVTLYEQTVKRSKEFNIANEWTRAAKERLNIYKPAEYPLLRQPALDLQLEDL